MYARQGEPTARPFGPAGMGGKKPSSSLSGDGLCAGVLAAELAGEALIFHPRRARFHAPRPTGVAAPTTCSTGIEAAASEAIEVKTVSFERTVWPNPLRMPRIRVSGCTILLK